MDNYDILINELTDELLESQAIRTALTRARINLLLESSKTCAS